MCHWDSTGCLSISAARRVFIMRGWQRPSRCVRMTGLKMPVKVLDHGWKWKLQSRKIASQKKPPKFTFAFRFRCIHKLSITNQRSLEQEFAFDHWNIFPQLVRSYFRLVLILTMQDEDLYGLSITTPIRWQDTHNELWRCEWVKYRKCTAMLCNAAFGSKSEWSSMVDQNNCGFADDYISGLLPVERHGRAERW